MLTKFISLIGVILLSVSSPSMGLAGSQSLFDMLGGGIIAASRGTDPNEQYSNSVAIKTKDEAAQHIANIFGIIYAHVICGNMNELIAKKIKTKVKDKIIEDFPKWGVWDNIKLKIKTYERENEVENKSCAQLEEPHAKRVSAVLWALVE